MNSNIKHNAIISKYNILEDFINIAAKTLLSYSFTIQFLSPINSEEIPAKISPIPTNIEVPSNKKKRKQGNDYECNLTFIYCQQLIFYFNYYLTLLDGIELFEDSYFINGMLISAAPLGCLLLSSLVIIFGFNKAYFGYMLGSILCIAGNLIYCFAEIDSIWQLFISRLIFGLGGVMMIGQSYLEDMHKSLQVHSGYISYLIMPVLGMSMGQFCISIIQQFSVEIFSINDRVSISIMMVGVWAIYCLCLVTYWKPNADPDTMVLSTSLLSSYGERKVITAYGSWINYLSIFMSKLIQDSLLSITIYLILDIALEDIGYLLAIACILSIIPVFTHKYLISNVTPAAFYLLNYALLVLAIGTIILFSPQDYVFMALLGICLMLSQELELISLSLLSYYKLGSIFSFSHQAATDTRVVFMQMLGRLVGDCSVTLIVIIKLKKSVHLMYPVLVFIMIMLICISMGYKEFKAKMTRKKYN